MQLRTYTPIHHCCLQPSSILVTTTRNGVEYITRLISSSLSEHRKFGFLSFSLGMFLTVCLPWTNTFLYFRFYVLTVALLKGMGERFLLSKDESLTPNIDKVMEGLNLNF